MYTNLDPLILLIYVPIIIKTDFGRYVAIDFPSNCCIAVQTLEHSHT